MTPAEALRREQAKAKRESLELALIQQLRAAGITGWEREYEFHPTRKWRFDIAFPLYWLAVEVDGGTWSAGRHVQSDGYENDCEKIAEAMVLGWSVLRVTSKQVRNWKALGWIEKLRDIT